MHFLMVEYVIYMGKKDSGLTAWIMKQIGRLDFSQDTFDL